MTAIELSNVRAEPRPDEPRSLGLDATRQDPSVTRPEDLRE
jgi:hypothetical protein